MYRCRCTNVTHQQHCVSTACTFHAVTIVFNEGSRCVVPSNWQDRKYLIPPLLCNKPVPSAPPRKEPGGTHHRECMLTFLPKKGRQQHLKWKATEVASAIIPPGFFARLTAKAMRWMFQTNQDCNESVRDFIWKDAVQAYSTKFSYELLMKEHNMITIRLKASMQCPERVLIPLKRAVEEVMRESNIHGFQPRFLIPHDSQYLCYDEMCDELSTSRIPQNSSLSRTINEWVPPRPSNSRHHVYLTRGASLADTTVAQTLYETLLAYVEVPNEESCRIHKSGASDRSAANEFANIATALTTTPMAVLLVSQAIVDALVAASSGAKADTLLYEWWLAVELLGLHDGTSHMPTARASLKTVMPLFTDAVDVMAYENIKSSLVCRHTFRQVQQVWKQLHLPGKPKERSTKSIVQAICGLSEAHVLLESEALNGGNEYDSYLEVAFEVQRAIDSIDMSVPSLLPSQIAESELQQLGRIGGGKYGDVYKGLLEDRWTVAIKVSKLDALGQNEKDLREEAELMAQFRHINIVAVHGIVPSADQIKVVLEFCDKGSLQSVLEKGDLNSESDDIPEKVALQVASDITGGMAYLETKGLAHRDLASRNVLVAANDRCKVADFGMSRLLPHDYYAVCKDTALPIGWCAPEVVVDLRHTSASDVWSFFVLMWEVWSKGACPFMDSKLALLNLQKVSKCQMDPSELLTKPAAATNKFYLALQKRCFCADPAARETFTALHDWIQSLIIGATAAPNKRMDCVVKANPEHYLKILHDAGGQLVIAELKRGGLIHTLQDEKYFQLGKMQQLASEAEFAITSDMSHFKIEAKLQDATERLNRHSKDYCDLFESWGAAEWLTKLTGVHSKISSQDPVLQPNPWENGGIVPSSKRYLMKALDVFSSTENGNPLSIVTAACKQAVAKFGTAVEVVEGPLKQEQRIMEKAQTCSYDEIRDYARLSLIASGDVVPDVVQCLCSCPEFRLVRAKNRLDPAYNAQKKSAGYRDYQLLARLTNGVEWVVEIQVIPSAMYALKVELGHAGYVEYRFILEACRRAATTGKGGDKRLHVSFASENAMDLLQYKDQVDQTEGWRNQKLLRPGLDENTWFESWEVDLKKSDAVLVLCSQTYFIKLAEGLGSPVRREADAICKYKDTNPDFLIFAFDPGNTSQGPVALQCALANGDAGAHGVIWRDKIQQRMDTATQQGLQDTTSLVPGDAAQKITTQAEKLPAKDGSKARVPSRHSVDLSPASPQEPPSGNAAGSNAEQTTQVSLSCIREFLDRKGLVSTLAALDQESPRDANSISSRKDLVKMLNIYKIVRKFLKTTAACSLLEIIADHWILSSGKHSASSKLRGDARWHQTTQVSLSCIREFLHRKGLRATLAALDQESPRDATSISSRKDLVKILNIYQIVRKFLKTAEPCSLLEIVADHWISKRATV